MPSVRQYVHEVCGVVLQLYGLCVSFRLQGCASNSVCARVYVHQAVCVWGVVYTAGGITHAVCTSDCVYVRCGLYSR